jgi:hypothetical protein
MRSSRRKIGTQRFNHNYSIEIALSFLPLKTLKETYQKNNNNCGKEHKSFLPQEGIHVLILRSCKYLADTV